MHCIDVHIVNLDATLHSMVLKGLVPAFLVPLLKRMSATMVVLYKVGRTEGNISTHLSWWIQDV